MNSNDNHGDSPDPPPAGPLHAYIEPEMEARLTALVLGEASDFEREELERQMGETPELGIYRRRLETLHSLLRGLSAKGNEAVPEGESSANEWKLSAGRRQALLAVMGGAEEAESGSESEMAAAGIEEEERHGIALVLAETNAKPHSRTKISWFRVAWGVAACMAVAGMAFLYLSFNFVSDSHPKSAPPMITASVASEPHESSVLSRTAKSAETAKSAMPMAVTDPAPESFRFRQAVPGKPMVADGDGGQTMKNNNLGMDFSSSMELASRGGDTDSRSLGRTASDFDNGFGVALDAPNVNKPDEGNGNSMFNPGTFTGQNGDDTFKQQQALAGRQLAEMGKKLSGIVPSQETDSLNPVDKVKPVEAGGNGGRIVELDLVRDTRDSILLPRKGSQVGGRKADPNEPPKHREISQLNGTVALAADGEILSHPTGGTKLAITNIEGRNGRGESAQNSVPAARPDVPMPAPAPIFSPTPIAGQSASAMGGGGAGASGGAPLDDFKRRSTVEASSEPQPARRESTGENAGEKAVAADVTKLAADPFAAPNSNFYFDESRAKATTEMGRSDAGLVTRPSSEEQAIAGPMQTREKAKGDIVTESLGNEVGGTISSSSTKFKALGNNDELRTSAATRSAGDAVTNGRGNLAAAPSTPAPAAKDLSPEPPAAPAAEGLSDRDSDKVESFGTMVAGERRDSLQALAQREEKVQKLQELKKEVEPSESFGQAAAEKALEPVRDGQESSSDDAENDNHQAKPTTNSENVFRDTIIIGNTRDGEGSDGFSQIGQRRSQPGAIRTWSNAGESGKGYKLYDDADGEKNVEKKSGLEEIADLVPLRENLPVVGSLFQNSESEFKNPRTTSGKNQGVLKGHGQVTPINIATATPANAVQDAKNQPESESARWRYKDWSRLRLDYGVPVGADQAAVFADDGRIHIGATADFGASAMPKPFATHSMDGSPQPWFGQLEDNDADLPKIEQRTLREVPAGLDEISASGEPFSTFSLHVSDVSFQLAQTALAKGEWPEAARIRIEEFVNAFDYSDPMPSSGDRVACRIEQAAHPFLQQRNLMRIAMRTAEAGRASGTPLRLTLLLDNSGSMERADRQDTVRRAFATLASLLKEGDQVTLIAFARQPRLLADGVGGEQAGKLVDTVALLPSEGGTNLEAALKLAHEKARQHHHRDAQNRVVLLTDGAANLGDAKPESLSRTIEEMRLGGIAFDAAGIGADGLNDDILEALTRKGDGRYYLLNSPEDAEDGFAKQIAGALRPAAKNVKVQVEFNPNRVSRHKLLGFEKHLLEKEDFRNDAVDAAEMAAAEAGVAVYQVEPKPDGEGDIGAVSVRFQDTASGQMIEKRWPIPYAPDAPHPHDAAASLRLATVAAQFAAKLKGGPLADVVDLEELARLLGTLPESDQQQERVRQLGQMIEQARQLEGK